LSILLLPAVGIFIVGYTDNILTARTFALRRGHTIHNNQEFLALGAANIGSALVGGFPASSSASRTVVAEAGGARTQLYSLIASGLVLICVVAFGSVIGLFPLAALGGLVIYAAVRLVDVRAFQRLWRFRKREFLLAASAFAGVLLFDILYGVLAAVALSIVELLTRVARPHAAVLGQAPGIPGWHDIDDNPLSWQTDALCAQTDPESFFPEKGGSTRDAKRICESCEVSGQCLEYALANDERFGIWGGLSERERRRLRRRA
jgi:MFS superfamily sulfate permease-like transporter